MSMRPFAYSRTSTVADTLKLLQQENGSVRPLAGGTDLLALMKKEIVAPDELVDVKRLSDLPRGIEENRGGVTLGALTSLSEIERSPLLQQRYPALAEAAAVAATPQLRNMATLGGNLLQRPRCWYFRHQLFHCWLKGGEECFAAEGQNQYHALFGHSPCVAVHPSDLAPALLALDARVRLQGPAGQRQLPLQDFFALPEEGRRRETTIGKDELLLAVDLPAATARGRSAYFKAMDRKVWAFALVSVALWLRRDGDTIDKARLALGGVANVPWRATAAEKRLQGRQPSASLFEEVAAAALAEAEPLALNEYKLPLARTLIRRALESVTG